MTASYQATKTVLLPKEDSGMGIARVHSSRIDASRRNHALFFRHEVITIRSDSGRSVVCQVMGSAGTVGITRKAIALDYDARDALGIGSIEPQKNCNLHITRSSWPEILAYYYSHPSMAHQIATRLGILSLLVSMMGLTISLLTLL